MLVRPRKSRIFYLRKLFDYPLKLNLATLRNLGLVRTLQGGIELYGQRDAAHPPRENARGFSDQPLRPASVSDVLQELHRKGVGRAVRSNQRGMGRAAHQGALFAQGPGCIISRSSSAGSSNEIGQKDTETSLIEKFLYPKLGPGQLWEEVASRVRAGGGEILTGLDGVRHSHLGRSRDRRHGAQRRGRAASFSRHSMCSPPCRSRI